MTVLLFILILSALILIHEGGHFFAAKRAGLLVHEFGIGFPPRLFAKRLGETEYSVNLLPFGGFVRIEGEDGSTGSPQAGPGKARSSRSFADQTLSTKLLIVLAGVLMNWLFAAFLFGVVQNVGAPVAVSDDAVGADARVAITTVTQGSPAQEAGLMVGDTIVDLRYQDVVLPVTRIDEVQEFFVAHAGEEVVLTLRRGSEERTAALQPRVAPPDGEGPIGVALVRVATIAYPWYESMWRGVMLAGSLTISLIQGFGETLRVLLVEGRAVEGLAGPVGIAYLTGEVRSLGVLFLVNFVALLSLNLAILNAIPFPALDGGRAVIAVVERLRGHALPIQILGKINAAGFVLLLAMIVAITIRDFRIYIL